MLKSAFVIIIFSLVFCNANAQKQDSLVFYYQSDQRGVSEVADMASADYFRVVFFAEQADNMCVVKEFYKNGKLKTIGKFDPKINPRLNAITLNFNGDVTDFYSNGKKKSTSHYNNKGYKDGKEYVFYPTGPIYCCLKNTYEGAEFVKSLYWECYEENGTMICGDGNGNWIEYDHEFNKVIMSGQMKKGLKEGTWHGSTGNADSIKYTYVYHTGGFVSALGYDKAGKSYPFEDVAAAANYKGGPITFVKIFKNHLKLPKDQDGKKTSVANASISFIVEKDGHFTDFKVVGEVSPEVENALSSAMNSCHDWLPSTYYGVPLRTEIILPLTFIHGYTGSGNYDYYREEMVFQERVLGF